MPRTSQEMRQRQHVAHACAQPGMPRKGNMKPDSRIDGRKKKNVICMACSWLRASELKVMPSVRFAQMKSSTTP